MSKKPYEKPTLVKREKLPKITAGGNLVSPLFSKDKES